MQRDDDPALTATVDASSGESPGVDTAAPRGRTTVAAALTTPAGPAALAPADAHGLVPGARLGRYILRDVIGSGGMGEVHAAYDPDLDRQVALKLLHRNLGAQAADRLRREARTMARLSHRNLVAVHDVGEHDGRLFLAMEFIDGHTLRGWARGKPWRDVLRAYLDAGKGLAAAHDAGVVHRDFKPDNVLLGKDGRVAVTDFGIARRGGGHALGTPDPDAGVAPLADVALTRTGAMIGTPLYMSPEQLDGDAADARSDQFAFAVALWEALYGAHPLVPRGSDLEELRESMRGGELLSPPARPVPARVGRALARALRPDPAARWPSLRALLEQLDVLRPRTLRLALIAGGAVAVAGIAAGVAFASQASARDPGAVCGGGETMLAAVWSPARARVLRDQLLATKLPFAAAAWDGVQQRVDRWGADWVAARTRTCRATAVFREQPQEVADRRLRCFGRQLGELDATLDQLRHADPRAIERAQTAVTALGDPARCETAATAVLSEPPLPAALAPLAEGAEKLTAQSKVAGRLGRYPLGLALARIAAALADGTGAARLRHTPHRLIGLDLGMMGQSQAALDELRLAVRYADEAGDDEARMESLFQTAQRHYHLGQYPEAKSLLEQTATVARRLDNPTASLALIQGLRGQILFELQQYPEAVAAGAEAVRLLESTRSPDPVDLSNLIAMVAPALQMARRYPEAEAAYYRALAMREAVDGPDHPVIASLLTNLASHLLQQRRYVEAIPHLERTQRIRAAAFGSGHGSLAFGWQNLGAAYRHLDRLDEAEQAFTRALALFRSVPDYEYALSSSLSGLANVLMARGRPAEAVPLYEESLSRMEARKEHAERVADGRFRLARALWTSKLDRPRAMVLAGQVRDFYAGIGDMPKSLDDVQRWMADPDHAVLTYITL